MYCFHRITVLTGFFLFGINFGLFSQSKFEVSLYPLEKNPEKHISYLQVYLAENPNGTAVIACPGGGYSYLEMEKEGAAFAPWFNELGITLIVLNYKLPEGNPELPLKDAKQAMLLTRKYAEDWNITPERIGVLGCSAGGHLASTLATKADSLIRPGFQILLYPVVTMHETNTHKGSRNKLLGNNPSEELVKTYSNELQVTKDTSPAFIVLSDDDNIVPSENSVCYYLALKEKGVSAEMHIYPSGGHGWGMHQNFTYYQDWTSSLKKWMEKSGLLSKKYY